LTTGISMESGSPAVNDRWLRDGYRSGIPVETFERLSLPFRTEAELQVLGNTGVSF
jgi:hypothetical protein